VPSTPKADTKDTTLEHPDPSSPLSEHATKQPDPDAPTDLNPPDGPHIQEIRGDPSNLPAPSKAASSSSSE
jgi:hypothetical protein